ncbi:o-succinylbenzoate synthase [Spirulina subsalsa FACHB-351]|uniref:o-succinylbenzoate synthase n=1 Tax=Spirulina subsalsa FACHB-351 TaxID=234711 RepID=A0ABT3LCI3_9CYAN|nr:o-succinylbenzoate synthase [Spirulina subsalsa]MCW6038695.1 o-succinylbenzoate synthase [Spirulina subsalsa FACHB-351]
MSYCFTFRVYQRPFLHPLHTHHGLWKVREGIILRLENSQQEVAWGEIAPLPDFGSETLEDAIAFCQSLGPQISPTLLSSLPDSLPACQFAFESAFHQFLTPSPPLSLPPSRFAYLLPSGKPALTAWYPLWQQGGRTFKWKIGVLPLHQELDLFQQLDTLLPEGVQLRLDANGGLTPDQTREWLKIGENTSRIEFLEQPLPPAEFPTLCTLQDQFKTPLALDESVSRLNDLKTCYNQGWRGVFVLKVAIAGSPQKLRQFCQTHPLDLVLSSVLETPIARTAALHLAQEIAPQRALGFGTTQWFKTVQKTWLNDLWTAS